jgi:3-methyl-2-oxobutanoate hydroxymethyltransferase
MIAGVAEYAAEVRRGEFPAPEHCYSIADEELAAFRAGLD